MKRTIFFTMMFATLLLTACLGGRGSGDLITEEREVSDFDRVELAGEGELTITQGESESLTIEAEDNVIPNITSEVRNGTLVIGMNTRFWNHVVPTKPIKFDLTIKDLTDLSLSGSGEAKSSNLNTKNLDLTISGSGRIEITTLAAEDIALTLSGSGELMIDTLSAKKIDATLSGSGEVELAGQVDEQNITVSGSGEYRAAELESKEAEIEVSGTGDVAVWVNERLDVEMNGSGNIEYVGEPTVTKDISGSGNITHLNQ